MFKYIILIPAAVVFFFLWLEVRKHNDIEDQKGLDGE